MVKGVVYKVFSRQAGKGTAYSIKLDGDENYYGCGFKSPGNLDGKYVSFEAGKNAKGYWEADLKTLTVMDNVPSVANKSVSANSKDAYWSGREERDLVNDRQRHVGASVNTAIAFVELLTKVDAIKQAKSQSDRADILFDMVVYYAGKFQKLAEGEESKPEPASAAEAAGSQDEGSGNAGDWS